jgi:hypothetical protein
MGSASFSGVKWTGCGINHPLPSNTRIKERKELHLYPPSYAIMAVKQGTLFYRQGTLWSSISITNVPSRLPVHITDRPGSQLESWLPFHEHIKNLPRSVFQFSYYWHKLRLCWKLSPQLQLLFWQLRCIMVSVTSNKKHGNTHIKVHILIILQFPIINNASYRNIFQTIHE